MSKTGSSPLKLLQERIFDHKKIDIYKIITYFIICAFLGWIFETSVIFFQSGKFFDRGLLFIAHDLSNYFNFLSNAPFIGNIPFVWGLPIIEIYGFGGIIMVLVIGKLSHKMWQLFIIGFILMTLFELSSSYFCSFILHQTYWDYSNEFLNFQGRISLPSSLIWGVMTIISVKYLDPHLAKLYQKSNHFKHSKSITTVIGVYTVICILYKTFLFK